MVVHTCNPCTRKAGIRGVLRIWGHPGLHHKFQVSPPTPWTHNQPFTPPDLGLYSQTVACHFQICPLPTSCLCICFLGLVLLSRWWACWSSGGEEVMIILFLSNFQNVPCGWMRDSRVLLWFLVLLCSPPPYCLFCHLLRAWERRTQVTQHPLGPVSHVPQ